MRETRMGSGRKTFEDSVAWFGLAGAAAGGTFFVLASVGTVDESWRPVSAVVVGAGSALFYGFGCFRIWPHDDPSPGKRSAIWFVHQYWLNAFGAVVGWVATFVLMKRYGDGDLTFSAGEFLLAVVAFLGLVGHLPFTVAGIAVAIRDLAKKILEKV